MDKQQPEWDWEQMNLDNWNLTNLHVAEDGRVVAVELKNREGWCDANVRWDGCMEIHLRTVTEEGNEQRDTLHTCDLDGLIEQLQELKQISQQFFNYEGYWKQEDIASQYEILKNREE